MANEKSPGQEQNNQKEQKNDYKRWEKFVPFFFILRVEKPSRLRYFPIVSSVVCPNDQGINWKWVRPTR